LLAATVGGKAGERFHHNRAVVLGHAFRSEECGRDEARRLPHAYDGERSSFRTTGRPLTERLLGA
jgi:hypothetical protein